MYRNDHDGKYPSNLTIVSVPTQAAVSAISGFTSQTYLDNWTVLENDLKPYISKLPVDPLNNGWINTVGYYSYYYQTGNGNCAAFDCYDLFAKLEDTSSPYRCWNKKYTWNYNNNINVCTSNISELASFYTRPIK